MAAKDGLHAAGKTIHWEVLGIYHYLPTFTLKPPQGRASGLETKDLWCLNSWGSTKTLSSFTSALQHCWKLVQVPLEKEFLLERLLVLAGGDVFHLTTGPLSSFDDVLPRFHAYAAV